MIVLLGPTVILRPFGSLLRKFPGSLSRECPVLLHAVRNALSAVIRRSTRMPSYNLSPELPQRAVQLDRLSRIPDNRTRQKRGT